MIQHDFYVETSFQKTIFKSLKKWRRNPFYKILLNAEFFSYQVIHYTLRLVNKGHILSAQLVLTLLFPRSWTISDPSTYSYLYLQAKTARSMTLVFRLNV